MYFLERRYCSGNASLRITGKELAVAGTITLAVYAISNMSYALSASPFSSQFPAEIFIIRTLADLGGVGMLFAYHMQLQMNSTQLENDFLQRMLQLQYDTYKMSAESVELVNQKYHDLKHQIQILRRTESEEEKNAYLDQMEEEIKTYEARNKTGNRVLDIILTTKSLQCQKQGISLTCVAEALGTGVLGGLAAYPIAKLLMGLEPAGFTVYMLPFFISTAAGSVLAFVLLKILEKSHVLHALEA